MIVVNSMSSHCTDKAYHEERCSCVGVGERLSRSSAWLICTILGKMLTSIKGVLTNLVGFGTWSQYLLGSRRVTTTFFLV